ncbi:MAG: tetratricopeptide repeat protein [Ignavibacteriales bacterium]|nr:tetratricopeptide repeat protein [Ignavibacteriales bacterium]
MLKPKKRLSKKEIKKDKLVTTYFEMQNWFEANRKRLGSISFGALIAVAAVWFYFNNLSSQNLNATADLGKVMSYYDEGRYEPAINGVPQANIRGLQQIVDDYGSTRTGEIAKLYLANCYFAQGNYEKALVYYRDADIADHSLDAAASAGTAACYEAMGNHAEAARYFEEAAKKDTRNYHSAENLYHAAKNHVLAGNKEKVSELLKRLAKDHPTSPYTRESERLKASIVS